MHIATSAQPSTSSEPSSSCVWMHRLGHVRQPLPMPFWMVAHASCMGIHPSLAHEGCDVGFRPHRWITGQAVTFFEVDFEGLGGDEHLLHTLAATVTQVIMERQDVIQEC